MGGAARQAYLERFTPEQTMTSILAYVGAS
jgi:hypothetical protein